MKKLLNLLLFAIAVTIMSCSQEDEVAPKQVETKSTDLSRLLLNKSTVYRVETNALWTTTLNQLQVITRFTVTPSTTITLDGAPAKLVHLKPGYRVLVYYTNNPACFSILPCYTAVVIHASSR